MIKLYHAPRTRSIRVLWLLEDGGITMTYGVQRAEMLGLLAESPNLRGYLQRLTARPALRKAMGVK